MNQQRKITYLDYAATTPIDSRVFNAMVPYLTNEFGNSSSIHFLGQQAESALESSRELASSVLNCHRDEVIFTSCGSESNNLAIRGVAFAGRKLRNASHVLISPVEHHAVSRTAKQLADWFGYELEFLPVDRFGMVDPKEVKKRIKMDTAIVSIIYANNEIGTVNPISEIGAICHDRGIPFHTDAVQAAAYQNLDVNSLNVDLMSLGSHKFYGPKGVGALYVKKGTAILPIITGGGQEFNLRAGTHNIAYIVGFSQALHLAQQENETRTNHVRPLRDKIIERVLKEIPDSQLTGNLSHRMPNHASFVIKNANGNLLLSQLDRLGYACSSGSACKTGNPEPSDVLIAMGFDREWALGSLRVTLGNGTTQNEVEEFLVQLPKLVEINRSLSNES